jgi:hypothetical protein
MRPTIQELQLANTEYSYLRKFMINKDYVNFVIDETNFLKDAVIKQRLWHLLNEIKDQVKCKSEKCDNKVKWNIKNNSYRSFCSSKCAHNDESVKKKIENTCITKFGVKTNLITNDSKENYSKLMKQKYGVDNPFKSKIVQDSIKDYFQQNYGVSNPSKINSVKKKINDTHENKYKRKRQSQLHYSDESYIIRSNKEKLVELYDGTKSIKDIAELLDVGHSQLCIQFKNFGIEIHQSVGQLQVIDFIKSIYNGEILCNDRKVLEGKEIDILLPELNIGIEYDGIFWHSQNSSGKINYHKEKDLLAKSKGIKLFHILDLEWNNKKELVKSRLQSLLGENNKIYGRHTFIKVLSKKETKIFFDENHIQGNANYLFCAGLEYEGKIIAAMSFGKSRYTSHEYELIRFCNIKGINVIGGASKLFKYSTEYLNCNNIISFCDLRWGTGNLYSKLGFNHIRDNNPSYSYTHNYKTYESRIKYQKHKLEKLLPIFDPNLTEWENMKNNGYDRYWNSGNSVWVWTNSKSVEG